LLGFKEFENFSGELKKNFQNEENCAKWEIENTNKDSINGSILGVTVFYSWGSIIKAATYLLSRYNCFH